jgi:pimeloyl-ACP methyl ester carboxylesterase
MPGLKRITGAADLAAKGEPGSWVDDAARERFMAAYARAFAQWPQPYEEFDVETATATTRVHAYRPHPGGDPVVLLNGFNAASWYPHVAALAEDGPVYGIDMPGTPSPSVARTPIAPPDNCAAWLDELLGKLSGPPAHLVGFSYGGWVAMNQAIRAPGRVASVTLLDPAGLTKLDARFWVWLSVSGLRAVSVPALLVAGARSAMLTPAEARARGSLMPHAEVAVVPGSHGGFDRIDALNDRISAFIRARTADQRAAAPPRPPASNQQGPQGRSALHQPGPGGRLTAGYAASSRSKSER